MKRSTCFLAIVLMLAQKSFGGIEPEIKSDMTGSALNGGTPTVVTYDPVFYNSGGTRNGTSTSIYSGLVSARNLTWLEINQSAVNDCLVDSFTFSVDLMIESKDKNGSSQTTQYVTLTVHYDKAFGVKYADKHSRVYYGGYWCKVTVLSVSNSAVVDYVQLNNSMLIERYKALNTATVPTFNTATTDEANGVIEVDWNTLTGAEEYDLEWVFIDDYNNPAINFGTTGAARDADDIDWTFKNNATRVTVKDNTYKITYLDEHGYLLVRVRAVGRTGVLFTHRVEGAWSSDGYGTKIDNGGGSSFALEEDAFHFVYATAESGVLSDPGVVKVHESTLNWQYVATFAEEGKKKEVIGYSDGSMRNRQSVTKINSENMAIAGETVYDYQGRQAGSFMPVPTFENRLKFYPDFNLSDWSGKNYGAVDFDSTTSYCPTRHIATLDETAGAGLYYSANNPLSGEMHYEYLPDAQGYAFTITEYMPDGTGRVRRQSGVGPDHKLGSGHETKYYYGTPDQVELDRLFGTGVGYSQHYQKNMVIDPNGQASVSYLDLQGRVIATALAGAAPSSLDSLPGSYPRGTLTVNMDVDAKSDIYDNRIETVKQILVAVEDDHTFDYSIEVPRHTEDSKPSLCFDCSYNLEIQLLDECGVNVLDGDPNTGGVQLYTRIVGRPQAAVEWDVSCSTLLYSFTLDNDLNNDPIVVNLPVGSYTLIKTLTINEEAYAYYESQYLEDNDSIKSEEDFRDEFISQADFGQCETNCDSCFDKLGSWEAFLAGELERLTGAGITPNGDDTAAIEGTYLSMQSFCQGLCEPQETTCEQMLDIILADVSPGGQYAPLVMDGDELTYGGILNEDPGVISSLGFSYQVHWTNSGDPDVFANFHYRDEDGNPIVVKIGEEWLTPSELTPAQYVANFRPVWAGTLAPFHPEYCKYKQCVENRGAERYEQNMLKVTNFQEAVDSGFLNPLDTLSPFSAGRNDPYFEPGGNGSPSDRVDLANLLNEYKDLNGALPDCDAISAWDLAKATYLCNYTNCIDVNQCLEDNDWVEITCQPILDDIWIMFRSIYLAERRRIMEDNYPDGCPRTAALSGHIERFPKLDDIKDQVLSSETDYITERGNTNVKFYLECDTNCMANADIWIAKLKDCGWDEGDSTSFRAQLIAVCRNGCDPQHPYGASSSRGGPPRVAIAKPSYTSFRAVFEDYVHLGKITFSPGACDINSIGYPMDYDHNYTRFVDNDGKPCTKDGYEPDPCTQTMGNSSLKDMYKKQHKIVIPDSVKCEKCITCRQLHTALSVTQAELGGSIDDGDYDVKLSVTNSLNRQLNFNLGWMDYYDFMVQCGEFTATDSNILEQFLDLWVLQENEGQLELSPENRIFKRLDYRIPWEQRPGMLLASSNEFLTLSTPDTVPINSCMCNALTDAGLTASLTTCLAMYGTDYAQLRTFCEGFYHRQTGLTLNDASSWSDDDKDRLNNFALAQRIYVPVTCFDNACDLPPANETNPFYSKTNPDPPFEGYGGGGGSGGGGDSATVTSCDSMLLFLHLMDSICQANLSCIPSFREMIKQYLFNKNSYPLSSNGPFLSIIVAEYEAMFPHLKVEQRFGSDPFKKFLAILHLYNECIRESYFVDDPACCRQPNKYALALMATINKMASDFDPMYGNTITIDDQKIHPDIPQYYNSPLYDGLYKTTVEYTTDPYGMPDLVMKFTDSLMHLRKVILSYTSNLGNEAEWSLITRVKKFRLVTLDYECDSTNMFEFTAVQLTSRGEKEVTISGYFPNLNLGDTCDPDPSKKLCDKNYWDSPIDPDTSDCYKRIENWATYMSERAYEHYIALQKKGFRERYLAKCLGGFTGEEFTMEKPDHEYHYTLYYYDQAGNLMQTVPPKGVNKITNPTTLASVITNRVSEASDILPSHSLESVYAFNSLNQLIIQETPDAGQSKFWYDNIGRLVISQNAKQFSTSPKSYSYNIYDALGRIKEVGELKCSTAMTVAIAFDPGNLATYINSQAKAEVTRTFYDEPSGSYPSETYFVQENMRSRVSSIQYFPTLSSGEDASGTYTQAVHYTYDIHGNVNVLLREIPALADIDQDFKSTIYKYDLVSDKVNQVIYQLGQPDMWAHKIVYDADNMLTETYTSQNLIHWDRDARYQYFLQGANSRTELGELSIQGIDYAYTLRGWIKGVNNSTLRTNRDIGQDGEDGSDNQLVGKDVFGYSLGFYEGDYAPIGSTRSSSPLTTTQLFTPLTTTSALGRASANLYNGNIQSMVTAIKPFMALTDMPQARAYRYDQLNRIADAYTYDSVELDSNLWKWRDYANPEYQEHFTYDANGNILTLSRNGTTDDGSSVDMDDFTYHYVSSTNKLNYVDDSKSSGNYSEDIDDQASNNYDYDQIGNLVSDDAEEIASIQWTLYGKIASITRSGGSSKPDLEYEYSPEGHRVSKKATDPGGNITITYYIRDAEGNTMSTYTRYIDTEDHDTFTWKEAHIYGSSRLGLYNADKVLVADEDPVDDGLDANEFLNIRGKRSYELSNHLGNVLVVISDKRTAVCDDDEVVAYDAEILDATDYYAFGSPMPGRQGITRCHIEADTTTSNVYDINETFTGTSNVGAFAPVSPGTTLTNTGGNEMLVTSTVTQPVTNVMFTMVNGRNYTISTDLKNMSSLPPGYTTSVLCEIMVAGFPIASGSMTANGSTYSFNFTGTTNGTAYVQYTFVIVSPPPFPPPPPIFPPYFFAIDNVRLYYVSTTYSNDTICVLDRNGYRYGFNGKEKDNEIFNGCIAFEERIFDSRIGRYFSTDPKEIEYPWESTYCYYENSPISVLDYLGMGASPNDGDDDDENDETPESTRSINSNQGYCFRFTPFLIKINDRGNMIGFYDQENFERFDVTMRLINRRLGRGRFFISISTTLDVNKKSAISFTNTKLTGRKNRDRNFLRDNASDQVFPYLSNPTVPNLIITLDSYRMLRLKGRLLNAQNAATPGVVNYEGNETRRIKRIKRQIDNESARILRRVEKISGKADRIINRRHKRAAKNEQKRQLKAARRPARIINDPNMGKI